MQINADSLFILHPCSSAAKHPCHHRASELQFQGELNLPWVVSLAADHPEGRVAESSGGNSELDMIGDVKELGAELQVEAFAFAKWIILEKTEIEIVQAMGSRVGESAGAGTVRERGRLAKRADIEPPIQPVNRWTVEFCAMSIIVRNGIAHEGAVDVGDLREISSQIRVIRNGKRPAALGCIDSVQLPS